MTTKKHIFSLLIVALITVSCSDDNFTEETDGRALPLEEVDMYFVKGNNQKTSTLGCGYDITGKYLNIKSIKNKVIDVEAFIQNYPYRYDNGVDVGISSRQYYGGDCLDFTSNIRKKTNFSPKDWDILDSSAVDAVFAGEFIGDASKEELSYARDNMIRSTNRNILDFDIEHYPDYLNYVSLEFKNDVQTLAASDIIEKYGTHVLTHIDEGGFLTTDYKAKISDSDEILTKSAKAHAGLSNSLKYIGLPRYNISSNDDDKDKGNTAIEITLTLSGGDQNNFLKINGMWFSDSIQINRNKLAPNTSITFDFGDWMGGMNSNNVVLVSIWWSETYPIYKFIQDPKKQSEVRQAYIDYINSKKLK